MSVYFYDLPTSRKRRNKLVYPSGKPSSTQHTSLPQLFETTGFKAKAGSYLQWRKAPPKPYRGLFADQLRTAERKDAPVVTSYVIADFDTEDGLDLLKEAVESLVYLS
jgi:UDP-glucose:glycoprotein glucosyltransferase